MTAPSGRATRRLQTPVGCLRLSAAAGRLVAIDWVEGTAETGTGGQAGADDALLERAAAQLGEYFAGRRESFDLPLAPVGSPFQHQVWDEMARIPYGRTLTYGELARRIDGVARAVGRACGANPIPIVIPCHRVLGGGGALGGFSGGEGASTKRALLDHEGVRPAQAELFPDALSAASTSTRPGPAR